MVASSVIFFLGDVLKCDHSHRVAQSMISVDPSTRSKDRVFYGLHGVLSERNQVLSLVFTKSVSAEERLSVASELNRRYDSHGHDLPVIFQDRCCTDTGWLRPFGDRVDVRIDGAHLLARYEETLFGVRPFRVCLHFRALSCASISRRVLQYGARHRAPSAQ